METAWRRVLENGGVRLYSVLAGGAAALLTARVLGAHDQGVLAAAVAWVSVLASVSGLSLGHVSQYRIQQRADTAWLPPLLGTMLLFLFGLTLTVWLLAGGAYLASKGNVFQGIPLGVFALASVLIPLFIWEEYSSNLLAAAGRLRIYNLAQFIGRTAWLIGAFVLVWLLERGINGALFAQASGQAIIAIIGFSVLWKACQGRARFEWLEARQILAGASRLHLNMIGSILLTQSGVLILNHYATKEEVGWYQLALQFSMILLVIPQAASLVLFSKMAESGPDQLWPMQKRLMAQVMILQVLVLSGAALVVPGAIRLILGAEFAPSAGLFLSLLPAVLGLSFAQLMTAQWIGRGVFVPSAILTIVTALASITANLFLIPKLGAQGAVWSTLVAYAGITVVVQIYFFFWCEKRAKMVLACNRAQPDVRGL